MRFLYQTCHPCYHPWTGDLALVFVFLQVINRTFIKLLITFGDGGFFRDGFFIGEIPTSLYPSCYAMCKI